MSFLRRFTLNVVAFVMRSSMFFAFTLLAVVLIIGKPDSITNILQSVDAYDRFSQGIVDQTQQVSAGQSDIPFKDPAVATVIRQSFSEQDLQPKAEGVINNVYAWLEGDQQDLKFDLDIGSNKQALATGLSNYAVERLQKLPECPSIPTESNIFKVDCRPAYIDLESQRKQINESIMTSPDFLPDTTLSQDDLPKNESGQTFAQAYSRAPEYFRLFQFAPFALLLLVLTCAAVVILLARTKRSGVKIVASSLISTAVFLSITPIIYTYVLPALGFKLPSMSGGGANSFMTEIVNDVTSSLYTELNVMLINVAIQVGALGFILYFLSKYLKSKGNVYVDLEKKAGVMSSLARPGSSSKNIKATSQSIPLQTSEGPKKSVVQKNIDKKYRKM